MDRLALVVAFAGVAVVIAIVLRRRKPDAPTAGAWTIPAQVDRADFDGIQAPWLVLLFSSSTCDSCAGVWLSVQALASDAVTVQEVEATRDRALHDRYAIDAVPTLLLVDAGGVVRASFVGPMSASELWSTVADVRAHITPDD